MNKQQLIDKIIEIIGSDISQEQAPQYEYTSNHRTEDLIEDRTSFTQMVLYADEMMHKIIEVRNLVLSQKQIQTDNLKDKIVKIDQTEYELEKSEKFKVIDGDNMKLLEYFTRNEKDKIFEKYRKAGTYQDIDFDCNGDLILYRER